MSAAEMAGAGTNADQTGESHWLRKLEPKLGDFDVFASRSIEPTELLTQSDSKNSDAYSQL